MQYTEIFSCTFRKWICWNDSSFKKKKKTSVAQAETISGHCALWDFYLIRSDSFFVKEKKEPAVSAVQPVQSSAIQTSRGGGGKKKNRKVAWINSSTRVALYRLPRQQNNPDETNSRLSFTTWHRFNTCNSPLSPSPQGVALDWLPFGSGQRPGKEHIKRVAHIAQPLQPPTCVT